MMLCCTVPCLSALQVACKLIAEHCLQLKKSLRNLVHCMFIILFQIAKYYVNLRLPNYFQ